ncbi:baseplate J/gp47 family protein [Chromobacterium alkanivorans]|uniref:baseplate J/gp47 family protein n=1 Tax=Chromobacterium alkanivorans TaxID=1071719 RepID=UPI001967BB05|nr:baseplate J/gp47 family protein [Chromobacterium alkanivorans]MBN3004523.1 baseplate J/gp47 family protein [Chromobacterium alkanivorans]
MAYEIPTLNQLTRDIRADLGAENPDALLRSDADVFGRALAAAVHGMYGYLQYQSKQLLPSSAAESTLLAWQGPFYLRGDKPNAAVQSSGLVRFTGNVGAPVGADVELQRDDGRLFVVVTGGVVGAGSYVDLTVKAVGGGFDGDTDAGVWLQLTTGVPGLDAAAQVQADGLTGGADDEDIESYRQRILQVTEAGAQTGRDVDWENWAKEIAGVTRAWAAPRLLGLGSMGLYFMRDDDVDPYPAAAECETVRVHLETTGTPWGEIFAMAPVAKPVNITLHIEPDTPAMRAAVTTALGDKIAAEAAPVKRDANGRTVLPVAGVTILRSHLTEAISAVLGETDHVLTVPAGNVACAVGELAKLGVITWT